MTNYSEGKTQKALEKSVGLLMILASTRAGSVRDAQKFQSPSRSFGMTISIAKHNIFPKEEK